VVTLEKISFFFSKKPICPHINQVRDDKFAPLKQFSACAPQNLFSDATFTHVYKPLDLDVWPKSRNGKKICLPNMFKLSTFQENK